LCLGVGNLRTIYELRGALDAFDKSVIVQPGKELSCSAIVTIICFKIRFSSFSLVRLSWTHSGYKLARARYRKFAGPKYRAVTIDDLGMTRQWDIKYHSVSYPIGPTQTQWVTGRRGAFFPREIKRVERETDHSHPTSAEVKRAWINTFTPPYVFMTYCWINYALGQLYRFTLPYRKLIARLSLVRGKDRRCQCWVPSWSRDSCSSEFCILWSPAWDHFEYFSSVWKLLSGCTSMLAFMFSCPLHCDAM
jgi:hypothetical protein